MVDKEMDSRGLLVRPMGLKEAIVSEVSMVRSSLTSRLTFLFVHIWSARPDC